MRRKHKYLIYVISDYVTNSNPERVVGKIKLTTIPSLKTNFLFKINYPDHKIMRILQIEYISEQVIYANIIGGKRENYSRQNLY